MKKTKTILCSIQIFCIWLSVFYLPFPPRLKLSHENIYGSKEDMPRIYYRVKRFIGGRVYNPYEENSLKNTIQELLEKQGVLCAIQLLMEIKGLNMSEAKAYCDFLKVKTETSFDCGIDWYITRNAQINREFAIDAVREFNDSSWKSKEVEQYVDFVYPNAKIVERKNWQNILSGLVFPLGWPVRFMDERLYSDIETMEELKEQNYWKRTFIKGKRICLFFCYEILLRIWVGIGIYVVIEIIILSGRTDLIRG